VKLDSDAPQLSIYGVSSLLQVVFIENSTLEAGTEPANPYRQHGGGGAYTYLRSTIGPGFQRLGANSSVKVLLSLHSDFPEFDNAEAVPPEYVKDQLP
jgi:hypothetical protein